MSSRAFISRFSPQRTKAEDLESILVQRDGLIADAVNRVRESVLTENKHHLLFIGPRGIGKTHLIKLIQYRLIAQAEKEAFLDSFRLAWLHEEETPTSFLKLLILIYRDLTRRYPHEFPEALLNGIYELDPDAARESLGGALLQGLKHRSLVLLMENLDAVFRDMPEVEQRTWRAFVQNHRVIATVATAQSLFSGVSDRDQPFFGFFDTRHLDALTVVEAVSLLQKLAQVHGRDDLKEFLGTPTGSARVQAIHDLAGGNPRLYVIFADFLTLSGLQDLVGPFEEIVDQQLTSYYQERLRSLSPQQREIIQFLCRQSRPIAVKHIAEALFATQNSIANQLKTLRDLRVVRSKERGRESLYELTEPLMRLSLQVKQTHDHQPLNLIVDFLRVWYDRSDLERTRDAFAPESLSRLYLDSAIAKLDSSEPNLRHQILREGLEGLALNEYDELSLARLESLAKETDQPEDWLKLGCVLFDKLDFPGAIKACTRAVQAKEVTVDIVCNALLIRGDILHGIGDTPAAIQDHTRVIETPGLSPGILADALLHRGVECESSGRSTNAIADFSRAIALACSPPETMALLLYNRAVAHNNNGDPASAVDDYTRAIDLVGVPQDLRSRAFYNRGIRYGKSGSGEAAIQDFTRAIELSSPQSDVAAKALIKRGAAYADRGDTQAGIADYTRAIELLGQDHEMALRAMANRGALYGRVGNMPAAIADLEHVIGSPSVSPKGAARSLFNLGVAHFRVMDFPAALSDFRSLLTLEDSAAASSVVELCAPALSSGVTRVLFDQSPSLQVWSPLIVEFLSHFARHGILDPLGVALVQHLPWVGSSPLNHAAFDAWVDAWSAGVMTLDSKDQHRMEIPLRLLRTGISFLKNRDEGTLLALNVEERRILRRALELPDDRN